MIIDVLEKALKEKFLIGIYLDRDDTSKFIVGYVEKVYEEATLISIISPKIKSDGFAMVNMNLIYLIEYDTFYLKNIQKIINAQGILIKEIDFERNEKEILLFDFLNFCKSKNICITIKHNYGFDILGYIIKIDKCSLLMEVYTEECSKDGITILQIEDINEIYLEGWSQKKIEIFQNLNT